LASDLDLKKLAQTTRVVGLADVSAVARRILDGKIRGRVVVDVNR
jgi:acrylyl-CoA reductase (NADPH)